jgi:hypothetical protein
LSAISKSFAISWVNRFDKNSETGRYSVQGADCAQKQQYFVGRSHLEPFAEQRFLARCCPDDHSCAMPNRAYYDALALADETRPFWSSLVLSNTEPPIGKQS